MSIKLTNINALDWYSMGTTGITWLNGNHDIIFTHGIWLTGMIGDTLIGTTSGWGLDYSPGPIIDGQAAMIVQPEGSNTYRIYHIGQNSGPGDSDYDEWPVQWGAPDNPDGSPKVYGDQTAYMVYNDAHPSDDLRGFPESDPTPIEIHETVWDHSTTTEMENVIFFRYQLYNRGNLDIDDAALALWTDIDIYAVMANWGGYNADGNYMFNYYTDNDSGYIPRACAYVLLQGPVVPAVGETAIAFGHQIDDSNNLNSTSGWYVVDDSYPVGNGDVFGVYPDELDQLRNISLGLMPNGDPIIHPISGDTTTYTHDGNPATGDGWLWDYGSGGGSGFISSSSTFELPAGDSTEGIYALVVALGDSLGEALINLEDQVLDLKEWWVDNQLDIYDDENESLPESFQLFNAYPNPFNPTTTIEFSIPQKEFVTVKVYNIAGHEITTLINDELSTGNHSIKWDGSHQPSGVYFVQIESSGFVQTKKMVLLK